MPEEGHLYTADDLKLIAKHDLLSKIDCAIVAARGRKNRDLTNLTYWRESGGIEALQALRVDIAGERLAGR